MPKSWKKMFHFISYAANPSNKTEGQQFKPKLVTKQTPSTEPKVNSFNKSSYVYTGSIQCLRWRLTVYFPSGPLRAKMGCGWSDRSSKASTGFTSFEKVHTHTPFAQHVFCEFSLSFRKKPGDWNSSHLVLILPNQYPGLLSITHGIRTTECTLVYHFFGTVQTVLEILEGSKL